ncbi:GAF domain-containing protein [Shigella flexneri]
MATRGLKKPRGRTVTSCLMKGSSACWQAGGTDKPCRCAKAPQLQVNILSVKAERFCAFLGVPIIQRRQLLGATGWYSNELRQYDESEESFLVMLATQMAAYPSVAVDCLVRQYRQTRIPRITGSTWCGDCQRPAGCHVTFNGTGVSGISTPIPARNANDDRRPASGKPVSAATQTLCRRRTKKTAAIFDLYSTCFRTPGCVANCLPRLIKARWQSGEKRSLKNLRVRPR